MPPKGLYYLSLALLISLFAQAQPGKLLLVGGGSEKNGINSWSTSAYKWAGQGKKVAIVGMSTGSLANYFVQQCGAARAREFAVSSRDSANSQNTYDTLTAYDVIFFRGGDQYDYYNLYKDTRLLDAVNFVYNKGGVIGGTSAGMHILSSVVFTAENGTVYPDECIENPNNQYVTLEDDFLNLVPGFVFDTHFAERGRFGRLIGFLAHKQLNGGTAITGLGMDDMTCITVDENMTATVYGTGCANLYLSGAVYSQNGNKLLIDSVTVVQLLHGCRYNFFSGESDLSTLDRQLPSSDLEETGNYTILASGNSSLNSSLSMISHLVSQTGLTSDNILLLSGNAATAETYKTKLLELGSGTVSIFNPTTQNGSNSELGQLIRDSKKILFLENSSASFNSFQDTPNGILLKDKCGSTGMITAFAGADARYAGKTVIDNYLTPGASYYAELTFGAGLELLENTVIMPDTYLDSDIYENTSTAVPYAMVRDTLKYGIWLTNHNYMKYTPANGKAVLTGSGAAPVMIMANKGNLAGFSNHSSTGSGSVDPRMVAGFEKMNLSLIDETTPYIMGTINSNDVNENEPAGNIRIQNPVSDRLEIEILSGPCDMQISNIEGQYVILEKLSSGRNQVDVAGLRPGIYILSISGSDYPGGYSTRLIKF